VHVVDTIGARRKVVGELAVPYLAFVANLKPGIGGRRREVSRVGAGTSLGARGGGDRVLEHDDSGDEGDIGWMG
jgi:hypothetical protein